MITEPLLIFYVNGSLSVHICPHWCINCPNQFTIDVVTHLKTGVWLPIKGVGPLNTVGGHYAAGEVHFMSIVNIFFNGNEVSQSMGQLSSNVLTILNLRFDSGNYF